MALIANNKQVIIDGDTVIDTVSTSSGVKMDSDIHTAKIIGVGEGCTVAKVGYRIAYFYSNAVALPVEGKNYLSIGESSAYYFLSPEGEAVDKQL